MIKKEIENITLQFISHHNQRYSQMEGIKLALKGGCKWVQLRVKEGTDAEVRPLATAAITECRKYGAKLIINDRVNLALEIGADGVHLGKTDTPISVARKLLGNNKIIGGTANTFDDILHLYREGADYIGCGPFRYTTTKEKLSPILGIKGYKDIIAKMREYKIDIPIVAIGGITEKDIDTLIDIGLTGIAVSSAILNSDDPAATTTTIISKTTRQIV